jgi:hypothetical protein
MTQEDKIMARTKSLSRLSRAFDQLPMRRGKHDFVRHDFVSAPKHALNRKSQVLNRKSPQALLDAGYDATGIEATHEMLGEATPSIPQPFLT